MTLLTRKVTTIYQDIKKSLRQLYLADNRPWLVGFSGGKDSTMLASLVYDTLRRLLAKVEEYSECHRAFGLPDDLLNILKDDLWQRGERDFEIN